MELKENFISVILVTWNGEHLLQSHLDSICNQKEVDYELIIIDNNSTDDSANVIKRFKSKYRNLDIKYIFSKENTGTALGSNLGISHASGEYIFWISNDMEFDQSCLKHLLNKMKSTPECGICTPRMNKLINNKLSNIIDSIGGKLDFLANPMSVGINKVYVSDEYKNDKIFFSYGGALFIRTKLAFKTSGYDERYFTLGDDIDLSWRVQLLGYSILSEKKSLLYHRVSATLSKSTNREKRRYLSERNNFCSILKNYSFFTLIFILPIYILILFLEILFFMVRGKPKISYALISSFIWNVKEFKSTLIKRKKIQKERIVSDYKILSNMIAYPIKIYYFYDYIRNSKSERWKYFFN